MGPGWLDRLHGYGHDSESWDQIGAKSPGFDGLINGLGLSGVINADRCDPHLWRSEVREFAL